MSINTDPQASAIGALADVHSIEWVYQFCACLPLLGFVAFLLPDMRQRLQ